MAFLTPQMPKKTKNYFFALEVAKRPFAPAKAKSSRRVLRTIFLNAFFDLAEAQKKSNTPICVESGETARRAPGHIFEESAFAPLKTLEFAQKVLKLSEGASDEIFEESVSHHFFLNFALFGELRSTACVQGAFEKEFRKIMLPVIFFQESLLDLQLCSVSL